VSTEAAGETRAFEDSVAIKMPKLKEFYDAYHDHCPFGTCCGGNTFHALKAARVYPDASRVLDFGCGSGYAVRKMRERGGDWFGVELSESAYNQYLHEDPYFSLGTLNQFPDNHFDMVYSTEVFEHIPEEEVDDVIAQLARVIRSYAFLTISLRPSSNNNAYHCTLRPRAWWESKFRAHGFIADTAVVRAFQEVTTKTTSEILDRWSRLGPSCREFAENPPYELFGECQFWFFGFYKRPPQRSFISQCYLKVKARRWNRIRAKRKRLGLAVNDCEG
jgi:SAM-dependent methyltransferase